MTIDYEIVRAGALDEAMAVMAHAFDPAFGEAWSASQCSGVLAMPGATLLIARHDDAPIGFALIRTIVGEAELMLIAVLPAARTNGVGRALLEQAMVAAQRGGAKHAFLEVRADNQAIALYEQAGFRRVGMRANYYRGGDGQVRNALTFRRALSPALVD